MYLLDGYIFMFWLASFGGIMFGKNIPYAIRFDSLILFKIDKIMAFLVVNIIMSFYEKLLKVIQAIH